MCKWVSYELRAKLEAGWGVEASVSKGADWQSMERVWVTPSMREGAIGFV